jgi:transcriptional regulator with XRE-family HTH domain
MPLNSESPSTQLRQEFCLSLKAARERKGITLAEIASTTKIPASVFAALERSDLRRWPKGLFRRSFFRDYVRAIGLPVTESCDEFVRLFPDDEGAAPAKTVAVTVEEEQPNDVRLVLDADWHGPKASVLSRLLAAMIDGGVVTIAAAAIAWLSQTDQLAAMAIVSLTYFSLATALFGESPAKWALARRHKILEVLAQGPAAIATAWRSVADPISHVFGAAIGAPETVDDPEMRTWISDARRVGPVSPARLRVRIKVPQ